MALKNFTPLHNDKILLEIIAKGRLTKTELRIAAWVWRYSWGFNDKKGGRQDWTKATTQRKIAEEIEMNEAELSRNVNRMLKANMLFRKGERYQFNEHQDTWNLPNRQLDKSSSLTNRQVGLAKKSSKLAKSSSFSSVSNKDDKGLQVLNKPLKKPNIKKLKHSYVPSNDETRLSQHLLDKIKERKPDFKQPNLVNWAKQIHLLKKDKGNKEGIVERIEKVIDWCQENEFWQNNILSTTKLRAQFDQLELKMGKEKQRHGKREIRYFH